METSFMFEQLPTVLRTYAQKRRNGRLKLQFGEQSFSIFMANGRVMDIAADGKNGAELLRARLRERTETQVIETDGDAALDHLLRRNGYQREDLAFLRHETILSAICSLPAVGHGSACFSVDMQEVAVDGFEGISVGQLLLDIVASREESTRRSGEFPDHAIVSRGADPQGNRSVEEQEILRNLDQPRSVEALLEGSLLSTLHAVEALRGLVGSGVVVVRDDRETSSIVSEELFEKLNTSIDAAFDDVAGGPFDEASLLDVVAPVVATAAAARPVTVAVTQPTLNQRVSAWNHRCATSSDLASAAATVACIGALVLPVLYWLPLALRLLGR